LVKRNWSVPTSPRSPYKIREELLLLSKFEGKLWNSETQAEFGNILGQSDEFEGEAPRTRDWVGRARFGTMKFWGFVFKDSSGKLRITDAGKHLMSGRREDEILAKQLVKWQYPDNQHNGNEYPASRFKLHPFIATLKILKKVKQLSKDEIALFLFTMTKDKEVPKVASEIEVFRKGLESIKQRVPRKKFIVSSFKKQILHFYNAELKGLIGRTKQKTLFQKDLRRLRAKNRKKVDDFVSRHRKTFYDYADALIRYFRYTKLVSLTGKYIPAIAIAKPAKKKVELITKMAVSIFPYIDTDGFYEKFYGNLGALPLPYENVKDLTAITKEWVQLNIDLTAKIEKVSPDLLAQIKIPKRLPTDLDKLRDIEEKLKVQATFLRQTLMSYELRQKRRLLEIIKDFDFILSGDAVDPPTFLEWNTWLAFESLDVAERITPNLKFSDDMQPLCPASGNQPDLEVYYIEFALISEVTLKSGAVQWRDEAEPVPVHVIKIKRTITDKPVFGLFVAPRINDRTANVFYGCKTVPDLFGDTVCILPLTILQFQDILTFFMDQDFTPSKLMSLLEEIDESRGEFRKLSADRGVAWVKNIPSIVADWKQNAKAAE
jgi:hypothetical protein